MSSAGVNSRSLWRVIYLGILLVISFALSSCGPPASVSAATTNSPASPETGPVTVKILNPNVERAIVRVLGTEQVDTLDEDILALKSCSNNQYISVWAPGYFIETFQCNGSPKTEYSITLKPLDAVDNPNYAWNTALNCAACHLNPSSGLNEYEEWNVDGHSNAFAKAYFWNMYLGTSQNLASQTGPGFRLDYPNENGNCAFCHVPAALSALQQGTDLRTQGGQPLEEGITCDVCHKATDVLIGEDDRPNAERPGVLSLALLRPSSGESFSIGPWPDHKLGISANPASFNHDTACSQIFSEGKFCAACHYGKFFDTVIYNSYGEWLDSIYSQKQINSLDNQNYRSCQDCHMQSSQPIDGSSWAGRTACSQDNDSFRDFSHNMMKRDNTGDPILVQQAATVTIEAQKEQGKTKVIVNVVNTRAGHKLPTDSPLRHLILVVEVKDKNDKLLAQVDGPTIPEWGGSGDQPEDYAGKPGIIYANILKDKATNTVPVVAYWNPAIAGWENSDTRLLPLKDVQSIYYFVAPSKGITTITARLIYRYAFIDLIRQKGWPVKDILVNWASAVVP